MSTSSTATTINAATLRLLIDHERWATEQLFEAIASAPAEASQHPAYQRALDKIAHVNAARALWLDRLGVSIEQTTPVFPTGTSLADARSEFERVQSAWEQWGRDISDAALTAPLHYSSTDGTEWFNSFGEIALHVSTHGFLHRGQANTLLAQAGGNPVNMDLIFFTRKQV